MKLNQKVIKDLAQDRGMSLKDLSLALGMRKEAISEYSRGDKNCPKKKIHQIADFFGVNWIELVDLRNTYY